MTDGIYFFQKKYTRYVQALTSFDGDIDGLFEGDWLGVVVGCDHMNMSKSEEHDKNIIDMFIIRDTQDMFDKVYSPLCLGYERENGLVLAYSAELRDSMYHA